MAKPSRLMPPFEPAPRSWSWRLVGYVLAVVLVGAFGALFWARPLIAIGFVVVVLAVSFVEDRRRKRQLSRLVLSRQGESVCTFVRNLPYRELDTWVIRSVFEELQTYMGSDLAGVPIRPADRLKEDLRVDPEDLDDQLVGQMAQRAGRTLANCDSNPYYGKVATVEDLVRFLCAQPKSAA
jgi:hypothetical protein